jgi:GTP pyrophosphokinase
MSHNEYLYLKGLAAGLGNVETLKALNANKILAEGQTRKGSGEPYMYHGVRLAAHLSALGYTDDILLAAAILHDTAEDGPTGTLDLLRSRFDIAPEVIRIVALLDKNGLTTKAYYERLRSDWRALLIKISDRCHNISTMGGAFSEDKMREYIKETQNYVIPLCKCGKDYYPDHSNAIYAMKYHIESICATIEAILGSAQEE